MNFSCYDICMGIAISFVMRILGTFFLVVVLQRALHCELHPERLTWNLQITRLERKMIFQTSMIMFQPLILGGVNSRNILIASTALLNWHCLLQAAAPLLRNATE